MFFRLSLLLLAGLSAVAAAGSSNSLLDVSPDGKKLLAANTDNGTVTLVDLTTKKAGPEMFVGDHPEGVAWVGDGPLAIVTVYRDDKVVFLDTETGKVVKTLQTAAEPYGVVTSADGKRAYVSHDYPGTVSEIDVAKQEVTRTMKAGEWCRGLAIAPDGQRVFVSNFYTGTLTAVDLESGKVADIWPGRESDNLCRHVALNPKRPKAYLSHIRSRTHVFNDRGSIFPELSICTLTPEVKDKKRRVAISLDTFNGVYVTANPWESAVTPDATRFFTLYAGTDDMNYSGIVDDDYREIERQGVIKVGSHPRALRFRPDGKELYVYATMDFTVNVFDTSSGVRKTGGIKVCTPTQSPEWVRGKVLFQTSNYPMTRAKWISCSGCHPDGAQDGRVWQNPEGPRKTPPMFGLAHTHPLHYSADRDEVQDFEYTIRGPLMKGGGLYNGPIKPRPTFLPASELDQKLSGVSKDLDALAIYTNGFQPKLSPHIVAPGKISAAAERGKKLFFDKTVACAACHSGPYYTDSRLQKPFNLHDVGTGDDPAEKMGPKYDTPTLLGIYRSPPYLHHGQAKTLMGVLTTANPKDKHGKTSHLKKDELEDLVAFIKALPYETPPDETPNTVKDRPKPVARRE